MPRSTIPYKRRSCPERLRRSPVASTLMTDRMSQRPKLASLCPVTLLHNPAPPPVASMIYAPLTAAGRLRRSCAWNKSGDSTPGAVLFTSSLPDQRAVQRLNGQSFRGRTSDPVQCRRPHRLTCMFHAHAGYARQWFGASGGACTVASPSDVTGCRVCRRSASTDGSAPRGERYWVSV